MGNNSDKAEIKILKDGEIGDENRYNKIKKIAENINYYDEETQEKIKKSISNCSQMSNDDCNENSACHKWNYIEGFEYEFGFGWDCTAGLKLKNKDENN